MLLKTLFAACGVALSMSAAAATTLTVYTALEPDQLKAYKEAFEKANPDVQIRWVRESTGIITARLIAEKARPQADAVWGLAATSLLQLYGSLEQILNADPAVSRQVRLVQQDADNARLAQTLVRLRLDIPLGFNLKAIRYSPPTVTPADGRS